MLINCLILTPESKLLNRASKVLRFTNLPNKQKVSSSTPGSHAEPFKVVLQSKRNKIKNQTCGAACCVRPL